MTHKFEIGNYRPIYLWAGPGTIRMNKIKFMNYPVDEDAHRKAHTRQAADLIVNTLHANWIHLMYDWGFPPEIEGEDWEDFRLAVEAYHPTMWGSGLIRSTHHAGISKGLVRRQPAAPV